MTLSFLCSYYVRPLAENYLKEIRADLSSTLVWEFDEHGYVTNDPLAAGNFRIVPGAFPQDVRNRFLGVIDMARKEFPDKILPFTHDHSCRGYTEKYIHATPDTLTFPHFVGQLQSPVSRNRDEWSKEIADNKVA